MQMDDDRLSKNTGREAVGMSIAVNTKIYELGEEVYVK